MLPRNLLLILAATAAMGSLAVAETYKAGSLTITQPWARASIGEATSSAAYMKIDNAADQPDRLTAAKSDAAENAMLHESRMEDGVMKMVHRSDGVEIPAHGSAELKPLGTHIMLMGLKQPLKDGETVPLTLTFANQGEVTIKAVVSKQPPADAGPMHEHK